MYTLSLLAAEPEARLSFTDKLLSFMIIGAMVIGVLVGYYTDAGTKLNHADIVGASAPVAVGLWLMMWPVLCKVNYELLPRLFKEKGMMRQLAASLVANWIVGPFVMLGFAWITLPDLLHYRNGVILVGLARCIAMVLLWNQLAHGHAEYCAVLVAVNSVLQVILYAPLTVLFVGVLSSGSATGFQVRFWPVARSVLVYLGAPLVAGILTRYALFALKGRYWFNKRFAPHVGLIALTALVYTVFVLFALQGKRIVSEVGSVCRVAVPMFLYFLVMWTGVLVAGKKAGASYATSVTQAFTASSNNFELAIAIASATFGVESPEALAATVGPLIEVPVLLALVYVARWFQPRFGVKAVV